MALETTYTQLRDKLAAVLDRVAEEQEVVIVRRKGARDVALIPADGLAAIMETSQLPGLPKNAKRLLRAFRRAERAVSTPVPIDQLRREMKLGPAH